VFGCWQGKAKGLGTPALLGLEAWRPRGRWLRVVKSQIPLLCFEQVYSNFCCNMQLSLQLQHPLLCNAASVVSLQFGAQEPGSNSDIKSFARKNYGVTFPLMSKVDVNGQGGECAWRRGGGMWAPGTSAGS